MPLICNIWTKEHDAAHGQQVTELLTDQEVLRKHSNGLDELERKADELLFEATQNEINLGWRIIPAKYPQRGRTSGLSAKRGWAVRVLGGLIDEKDPNRFATISNLLTNQANLMTTRQQVRGILKGGEI